MCPSCTKLRQLGGRASSARSRREQVDEGARASRGGMREGSPAAAAARVYQGRKDRFSFLRGGISIFPCSCCGASKLFRDLCDLQESGGGRVCCPFCLAAGAPGGGGGAGRWSGGGRSTGDVDRTRRRRLLGPTADEVLVKHKLEGSRRSRSGGETLQEGKRSPFLLRGSAESDHCALTSREQEKEKTGLGALQRGLLACIIARRAVSEIEGKNEGKVDSFSRSPGRAHVSGLEERRRVSCFFYLLTFAPLSLVLSQSPVLGFCLSVCLHSRGRGSGWRAGRD